LYLKFWAKLILFLRDSDFQSIFARSSSAVTYSAKSSINTQNGRFPSKSALLSNKVCYKVSLYENRQRQICKTFIGLSVLAKVVGGDVSLYVKIQPKLDPSLQKRRFTMNSYAPQRKKFSSGLPILFI